MRRQSVIALGIAVVLGLVAVFLAVAFAKVALVAHDLAHRQVFRTNGPSARAGRTGRPRDGSPGRRQGWPNGGGLRMRNA